MHLAQQLCHYRCLKPLSQKAFGEQLATALGRGKPFSQSAVDRWETTAASRHRQPPPNVVEAAARLLGCRVLELLATPSPDQPSRWLVETEEFYAYPRLLVRELWRSPGLVLVLCEGESRAILHPLRD